MFSRIRSCLVPLACLPAIFYGVPCRGNDGLTLQISAPSEEVVQGEPVLIECVMTNESSSPKPFFGITEFTENMRDMYFRIVDPSGDVSNRRFEYIETFGITNPGFGGYPLLPGEWVRTTLSLAVTKRDDGVWEGEGGTFSTPGTYRVSVVYYFQPIFEKLIDGNDGVSEFQSNEIVLRVRHPNRVEEDVLDAIWYGGGLSVALRRTESFEHERILRQAVERHPDEPLSNYARLHLANGLQEPRGPMASRADRIPEAVELLEQILQSDSLFYPSETMTRLGEYCGYVGRMKEARRMFAGALEVKPSLVGDFRFMSKMIGVTSGATEGVREWCSQRRRGIPNAHEAFVRRALEVDPWE